MRVFVVVNMAGAPRKNPGPEHIDEVTPPLDIVILLPDVRQGPQ